jgi:hypothetical protein
MFETLELDILKDLAIYNCKTSFFKKREIFFSLFYKVASFFGQFVNSFAFNYRSHETKIVLFCVNAKWILASSSGLRGHRRTYLTILESEWSANYKMV